MTDYRKDILIGTLFVTSIFSLISGLFIISAALVIATVAFSNKYRPRALEV